MAKPREQQPQQRQANVDRTDSSDSAVWEISGTSTWNRLTLSKDEIVFRWQRYHPAYDEEPYVEEENVPANEFLGGRGKDLVVSTFGEFVWSEICDEIKKRNPGLKPKRFVMSRGVSVGPTATGSTKGGWGYLALGFLLLASFSLWVINWPSQRLLHQYRLSADGAISKHAATVVDSDFTSTKRTGRYSSYLEYRWVVKASVSEGDQSQLLTVSTLANFGDAEVNRYPVGSTIELLCDETSTPQVWALERSDLVSHWIWNVVDIIFIGFGAVVLIAPIWGVLASR